jgi:hypothetical protein
LLLLVMVFVPPYGRWFISDWVAGMCWRKYGSRGRQSAAASLLIKRSVKHMRNH